MLNHKRNTLTISGTFVRATAVGFLALFASTVSADNNDTRIDNKLDKKIASAEAYRAYKVGNYERALELYNKIGEQMPAPPPELEFNKGAANYRLGSFEDAVKDFDNAKSSQNNVVAENAHFNSGNTYFQSQQYDKAVEEYKEALKLDPSDTEAKYNLELALREIQKQDHEMEHDDDQEQDQDKDKEEDEEKQDKDKQDKEEQEDQDQQEQDQQDKEDDQKKKQDDEQEQKSQPDSTESKDQQNQDQQAKPQQMSKEDAERLLNSLKDEEMKQQKRKVLLSSYPYTGKKW
jgi:Ca-activated chloride channel homolog